MNNFRNNEILIHQKEYYNIENNNYYLKIGIDTENNLLFKCYKLDILNNICYQQIFDINKIKEINGVFASFCSMNEIYNLIDKLINYNKFKIEYNNDILSLRLFIPNIEEIRIEFDKIFIYDIFEYNLVITKTINQLKNELKKTHVFYNDTNSNNVLSNSTNNDNLNNIINEIKMLKDEIKNINKNLYDVIEENNKNKKKIFELKEIISNLSNNKINDSVLNNKLESAVNNKIEQKENNKIKEFKISIPIKNETKKDIKEEMISLKEFNKIFKLNLRNNYDITELKLGYKNLGLNKIKYLELIDFVNLEQLWLSNNNIVDISIFSKLNYKNLEKLDLSNNNIEDINALESVNFLNLKNLWMNNNRINDISVFSKVKFIKLLELNLRNNNIENINVFEKNRFIFLQILDLSQNKIEIEMPKNRDISDNLKSIIKYFNI